MIQNLLALTRHSAQQYAEYIDCVDDLLSNEAVQSMQTFTQHRGMSVLEHSICVSYLSYRICKETGLDYRSAARGGLLHDFFLYQRFVDKPYRGWHTLVHPKMALENAQKICGLNDIEQDIIAKHMFPVCLGIPHFKESVVVSMVDKYCCAKEFFHLFEESRGLIINEQFALEAI